MLEPQELSLTDCWKHSHASYFSCYCFHSFQLAVDGQRMLLPNKWTYGSRWSLLEPNNWGSFHTWWVVIHNSVYLQLYRKYEWNIDDVGCIKIQKAVIDVLVSECVSSGEYLIHLLVMMGNYFIVWGVIWAIHCQTEIFQKLNYH